MNKPLPHKVDPPSPLADRGATNPDIAANSRFPCGLQVRQTATRTPHGSGDSGRIGTQPRRTTARNETQTFRRLFSTLLAAAILVHPAPASARCHSHRCWHRVSVRRHVEFAWRWIRAHPMPTCTYVGESSAPGDYSDPYGERRYRARNLSSSAGGKYQLLDTSAHAVGIPNYPGTHDAAVAPPLLQERAARRLLAMQGIHAWERC